MLPLSERAVAALARTMKTAFGMESCKLVELDLLGRMLPAEDAATLSAMVATLEETEGLLAC